MAIKDDERLTDPQAVTLTEGARHEVRRFWSEFAEWNQMPLRLYISGKNCDGFEYGVSFDSASPEDAEFANDGVSVLVDPQALMFCQGSVIDWVDDERGKGFWVENPHHRHFRGKFFKKRQWREVLERT
jgi:iron-sulfur cluster assembly accessory protein